MSNLQSYFKEMSLPQFWARLFLVADCIIAFPEIVFQFWEKKAKLLLKCIPYHHCDGSNGVSSCKCSPEQYYMKGLNLVLYAVL